MNRMRVLHLPMNIASQMSATVRALRDVGVQTRGLALNNSPIQDSRDLEKYSVRSRRRYPVIGTAQTIRWWYAVLTSIWWADVVHWYYGQPALPLGLDLRWASLLRKAGVVEFFGSDIRVADIAASNNPYYAAARRRGDYSLPDQLKKSRNRQLCFAQAGFECVTGPLMQPHIQTDIFPPHKVHSITVRLYLDDFAPIYPSPDSTRPIIAHSPSRPQEKGTPAILAATEELRARFDFEVRLITGTAHDQALRLMRECDLYIDQLITGHHGVAATEAMAYGKPVVCYIDPSAAGRYPHDFPVVNANEDNLADVLAELLSNGHRRHELGLQGRRYVEKYHNAHEIARQLAVIYRSLIERERQGRHGSRPIR